MFHQLIIRHLFLFKVRVYIFSMKSKKNKISALTLWVIIILVVLYTFKIFKLTDAYSSIDSQFLCKREDLSSSFVLEFKIQLSKKNQVNSFNEIFIA